MPRSSLVVLQNFNLRMLHFETVVLRQIKSTPSMPSWPSRDCSIASGHMSAVSSSTKTILEAKKQERFHELKATKPDSPGWPSKLFDKVPKSCTNLT